MPGQITYYLMFISFIHLRFQHIPAITILAFLFFPFTTAAQEQSQHQLQSLLPLTDTLGIKRVLQEGIRCIQAGNADSAEFFFQQALQAGRKLHYFHGVATAFTGLSDVAGYKGDYTKALNLLDEAERNNNKVKKKRRYYNQQAVIMGKRGQVNDAMGNYDTAIYYYLQDMSIRENNGIKLGNCYANTGQLFRKLGNYRKSIYYLDLAEIEATNTKDSNLLSVVLLSKALTLEGEGDQSKIAEITGLTQKSLDIARKINSTEMQRAALSKLAGFAMNSGKTPDYKTALHYLKEAMALPQASTYSRIHLLINLAYCYNRSHNFKQGRYYINQAKILAEQGQSREVRQGVYEAIAIGYRHQGDYKNALEWYEKSAWLIDSISGAEVTERVNRMQVQYESARKDNELIRKELLITKQAAIIQKKNAITYSTIVIALLSASFTWLYYRNRRRMQQQAERQALEIAAWQASIAGEEKERSRIARDLHDNIGGTMSNLQMWLGTLKNRYKVLDSDEDYTEVMGILEHTITEVRNTAHHLMPELLLRLGLAEAVRIFCANIQKVSGIKIEYQYLGYINGLDKNVELIFYRGIQELVQNVVKHAHAHFILVQLSRYKQVLSVTIEDNGCGMNMSDAKEKGGIGLEALRRSITHLGGQFSIRSEPGNGTTVYFETEISELK